MPRCVFAETPCGNEQCTARTAKDVGPYKGRCMFQVGTGLPDGPQQDALRIFHAASGVTLLPMTRE